jgi:hypothetical protein
MTTNPPLKPLPENLAPMAAEMRAYYRELPGFLQDRKEGKYAVIRGDTLYGVWDTYHDALQYGYDKFPNARFIAQKIDHRFLPMLAEYFGPHPAAEAEVA